MSIIITNVSDKDTPNTGVNSYVLRLNQKVLCTFEHERKINGVSECLRDAADAYDASQKEQLLSLFMKGEF